MQNLDTLKSDSATAHFASKVKSFSSTTLELKQRYMQDFLKDLKKSEEKEVSSTKDILFEEIKGMLADF